MPDSTPFELAIEADWPVADWRDVTVLVAVSGGADSVALLHGLARIRQRDASGRGEGRLVVAHFNHGWRGPESDEDARFVRQLARKLSLPVTVGRMRPAKRDLEESLPLRDEESARRLRYRFLADVAGRVGARYIATAHTADDQVETILQRVLRGTGLAGLAGIPRVRRLTTAATLIRPMLKVPRALVIAYLQAIGGSFRKDSSNACCDFTRNRIRHELLPLTRSLYPGVDGALQRLGALASEAQAVIEGQVLSLLDRAIHDQSENHLALRVAAFGDVEPYILRESLRRLWQKQHWPCQNMGLAEWWRLAEMVNPSSVATAPQAGTFPGNICAKKQGELLTLTRPVR